MSTMALTIWYAVTRAAIPTAASTAATANSITGYAPRRTASNAVAEHHKSDSAAMTI